MTSVGGWRREQRKSDGSCLEDERETVLFTASGEVLGAARKKLLGCESCSSDAEVPFKSLLDHVMLFSGLHTDYIMAERLTCPWCGGEITEETLVDWE